MPHRQIQKKFLTNRRTMERYSADGLKNSNHKPKDKSLRERFSKHIMYNRADLPPKVDLRPWMTPVKDQKKLGSWYVSE